MSKKSAGVAKLIVRVHMGSVQYFLFSKKRSKGSSKHGLLELLGGGLDEDAEPLDGLVQELEEEERTGLLAEKVAAEAGRPEVVDIKKIPHYVFSTEISLYQYLDLRHGRKESLGFKLIPPAYLSEPELLWRLTPKTRLILRALAGRLEA